MKNNTYMHINMMIEKEMRLCFALFLFPFSSNTYMNAGILIHCVSLDAQTVHAPAQA